MYTPFTYLIGWTKLNKFYYGVRHARDATPNDLWTTYFTSSNKVDQLRHQHGEPDIIQVRKTFKTREDAVRWEYKVLRRLNVLNESKWVNAAVGTQYRSDGPLSEQHKSKISASMKKFRASQSDKERGNINSAMLSGMWGKYNSDPEFRDHIKQQRRNQVNPMQGKKHKRLPCPNCGKVFAVNQLAIHKNKGCH